MDWTVKLWRGKTGTKQGNGAAPVHSFEEADDYVFDVKWHPSHPAMFGTGDGTGKFDLWNLNQDLEVGGGSSMSRMVLTIRSGSHSVYPGRGPSDKSAGMGSNPSFAQSRPRRERRQAIRL